MTFPKNLVIVQYAGDFREAAERLSRDGEETYRAQRYTVEYVKNLVEKIPAVTTITAMTAEAYDVVLPGGARAIGLGLSGKFSDEAFLPVLDRLKPDALIVRSPFRSVFKWARQHQCRSLALLADSFDQRSLRARLRTWLYVRALNHPSIEIIGNHGIKAAQQIVSAGVQARKVIAWDYPAFSTPNDYEPKREPANPAKLLFVGVLTQSKGVDDTIDALARLKAQGRTSTLQLIGAGETERLKALAEARGVGQQVEFLGLKPNHQIISFMREADALLIPSRLDYSEGLPLTIYEGYCSRTPIIASNHPMFVDNIVDETSGLFFEAGSAESLASKIARVLDDKQLYAKLSENSLSAWERLQIPVKWADLIDHWLDGVDKSARWIAQNSLSRR